MLSSDLLRFRQSISTSKEDLFAFKTFSCIHVHALRFHQTFITFGAILSNVKCSQQFRSYMNNFVCSSSVIFAFTRHLCTKCASSKNVSKIFIIFHDFDMNIMGIKTKNAQSVFRKKVSTRIDCL